MRTEKQIHLVADGLTDQAHEAFTAVEFVQRQLPAIERRVRTRRIKLDGRETLLLIFDGALSRTLGVVIDRIRFVRRGINVGVGANFLVHAPTEQLVHRLPRRLADDVPARHLERAQYSHQRQIRVLREAARIHPPPDRLDRMRILTRHVARKHVFQHPRNEIRVKRHAVRFADATDAIVGGQLDEDEITPAESRRRIADHEGLDVLENHSMPLAAHAA